jgi:hypothetical protein
MKMRKITSLTAAMAFLMMVLTSIILYIVPQGRVAYWADWRLWGLSKTDWSNIHINLGFLFLISLSLHIYYNWKPITSYLKNKARQMKVFTPDFNVALVVTMVFTLGTYFMLPPFSWVLNLSEHIKDRGAVKYGEPPYGHAELSSIKTFATKTNLDIDQAMLLLEKAGYAAESDQVTLEALSKQYGQPPQQFYEVMKPATLEQAVTSVGGTALPDSPAPGTGNLTLADFTASYRLNLKQVVRDLKAQNIEAAPEMTLKAIAGENGIGPVDLYEILKDIAKGA